MGIGDKIGELKEKAQQALSQHSDNVEQGIDKVAHFADEKTGGKHAEQIGKGADLLKQRLGEQGQPPQ